MNKATLIDAMSKKTGFTKKDTGAVLDALLETVIETVVAGEEVTLPGLGKFVVVDVPERTGVIQLGDRKGESYVTPAHRAPKFKISSAFKNALK